MRALIVRLLTGLLLASLLACSPDVKKAEFKGTDIAGAQFGGDFTLTDHTGKVRSLSDFKGKVVALFFGYTHCPDVCPSTMLEFASAMKLLGAEADQVQVLFITVDPERDTPALLAGYVPHFDARFIGLSGSPEAVRQVEERFKIVAQKRSEPGGGYSVDHSAGAYLIDRSGRLRVYLPYGLPAADLAHDIKELIR
ncbi:SCO family protein [Pseudogulbenkiania sp. MAI-1]|uniref:SCO family protein n=1 Tax=Pseudogulbenkiania sp. MAI-1 TaxID=990370 RepID=UPI00045E7C18|nr:SCO family protein [Pseudogulbenkiania sp. MAI-1]